MSNPCCTPRPAPRLRQLDRLTTVYGALADATRLRILALLEDGEVCVCHIHASLGVPQSTASRHLAFLRRAGLVSARRDGIWMHYSLARVDDPVVAAVVSSALHALEHSEVASRDQVRLQRERVAG
ncbi:MAG TPA: metalloregulator ArsR/SmtB family transcription factor [Vicinamibacterales bacterium]|nr:metalloregulator ArsR/SmtB family transcription factor [Vicinamibacterales bacterium]